ncbi:MAG: hypothetical protein Q9221_000405 [Calogaya cf. arnoldii]
MDTTLEQLVNSSFPDQATFIQAATSARELSASTNDNRKTKSMAKPQGPRGVAKTKKKNVAVKSGKAKATRSVNSFMMFRCHYSTIFEAFQQKVISAYVVYLWQTDPFKAKWALLAKAYSVIRDHVGKQHAPLDRFLSLLTDFVGIISPHGYLTTMGFEVTVDELGTVSLLRDDTIEIDIGMQSTNMSVEDIITYASKHGYVAMGLINKGPVSQPSMTMAASAQSLPLTTPGTGLQTSSRTLEQNQLSSDVVGLANLFQPYDKEMDLVRFVSRNGQRTVILNLDTSVHTQVTPVDPASIPTGLIANLAAIDNVTNWDPDFSLPIFTPYERNAFDAFDISEWVHADAYAP